MPEPRSLRALGCVRVSTQRQAEKGYSIPEQRASIEACCGRHGLQLLDVLVDDGISGKILERPAIRKITELAEAGAFDVLVLVKLNRLGRENAIIQQLLARFRDRGIRVLFVEHGSGDTKEERLQLGILSAFAEFEWDSLREATMSGRERKAKSGKIPIHCPIFGYHCVTRAEATVKPELAGRDGELLVIEEEAKWVREVFQRYAAGATLRSCCAFLNEAGVRTKRGNLWALPVLRNLLENPTYMGTFAYGRLVHRQKRELTRSGKPKADRTKRDPSEQILIPCPAIIDAETYQKVQQRLEESRAERGGRPSLNWPLSGIVFCGVCHTRDNTGRRCSALRTSNEKKRPGYAYRSYMCATNFAVHQVSCGVRASANKLERRVLAAVKAAVAPGELGRRARLLAEAQRAEAGTAEEKIGALAGELEQLDRQEGQLADLALKGFADHIIQGRLEPIQRRRLELNVQLAQLRELLQVTPDPEEAERQGEAVAAEIRAYIEAMGEDPAKLRALFQPLVRVTLWPDREADVDVRTAAALAWKTELVYPT